MNRPIRKSMAWMKKTGYQDPDENLSALYVQAISFLIIVSASIIGVVYAFDGQLFYVSMVALNVLIYSIVIALVRLGKLWIASNLFLIAALGLLAFGIFMAGGIHASSSLLYPVILVFASLLLDRRTYIMYGVLCVASIGFIVFAENQGLTPVPYVPDPPNFPLFITYTLVVVTVGGVIRSITENLQNSSFKARQYSQELLAQKAMLDRVGQAVVGCKLDNTIIYWNQAAVNLYGWTAEEALGRKYYDMVATELTTEMVEDIRIALRNGEVWSGEMAVRNKDKNILHVLGSVAPLQDEKRIGTGWIGIAADLTERRRVEMELHQREKILEAVTFAAEQFIKTPDWRENIDIVLERLGRTINATHAYLFEDYLNPQGEPVTSMRYEWTAPGYPSDLEGPYFQGSPIYQEGFEEPVERLKRGEVRVGSASTFNPIEKEIMSKQGVKSILEVPIFVNGREWGAIGFDDFENEREWSPAEVDILKIAAGILSAAIGRQNVESAVRESERIYRQAIQAVGAIPYYLDYVEHRYTFMGEGIKEMTGYSPSELTPQLWGQMEIQRFPRGSMAHLTYEEADRLTEEGTLRRWECDYLILNRHGQERWVADASIQVLDEKHVRIGVVGILQDITDRKLTEAGLRKRESVFEAITFSAEHFLKTPDWRQGIDDVLERLGREFNASHAYLFEKHTGPDGVVLNSLRYEWTAPGQISDMGDPSYQNVPENEVEFSRYYEILNRGEPYIGGSSYFTNEERDQFNKAGIKAILELRIVVDGKQWGTLGFDDMVSEREWTVMEVDVLKVAANVLGAAIKRQLDEDILKRELAERKRTEIALRFSEEKFSKAFHSSPVLKTIEDNNNKFVEVNEAFLESFGFERIDVIGRTASELNIFYAPEDVVALRQSLQENNGILKDFEMRFRRGSGEMGFILLSSDNYYVDDIEYTLTSGLDITERKRVEEKYRDIFNNSIDGIFQSTENGHFINVNPAMARIYGYDSPEEMINSVNDIGTQVYVNTGQREEILRRLNAGEKLSGYETLDQRKDGTAFWASMTVQAIRDENGKIMYYEGTIEDVTQRKQAEETLRKLSRAVEQSNASIVITDTAGKIEYVNPFFSELTGYTFEEAIGENPRILKSGLTPDAVYADLWKTVAAGREWRGEICNRKKNGGLYWESVSISPVGDPSGSITHFVAVKTDITERKQAEAEREKLIDELGKKNAELEQFTYTVSHDLKSPLVTINGFLGYLEQDAVSGNMERLKKDTQRIHEAVQKMQRLLNELLELSRIGRMMNAPELIPFNELVEEAMKIVHGQITERGVAVHVHSDLPIVYGDRPRLVEVLQNLIDNAAKYMGNQSNPRIEIGQRGDENGKPVFFVRDNGMGIEPEHHERVFGLFNKLDARSEGTGVGLALVKRIVEVHGGRIWVESEAGMGATFLLTLPTGQEA